MAARAFREDAFPNHPYGRPSQGTLESVPTITRDDLVAMHRSLLARDIIKIAAVGAIDATRLAALVDKTFGALPAKAQLVPVPDVTRLQARSACSMWMFRNRRSASACRALRATIPIS